MILQLIERVVNISPAEIPRTLHSWLVKVVFFSSIVIGWTVVTASVVARMGIHFLPVLFLFQAIFTIIGMMFFSLLAERLSVKKLILLSTSFGITTLIVASINYSNDYLFLVLALIANGIFLSQAGMFLSSYIEDLFSPSEAERAFPVIESAETIGGIVAGVFLAYIGRFLLNSTIFWFWAALLLIFLLLISFNNPRLPFFLENVEKKTKKHNAISFKLNSFSQSLNIINRIPFLQVLIAVLLLNWIIAIFVEFQFTKAIDATVAHDSSLAEHEQMLVHGLGNLHILIHGLALVVELLVANKILTKIGTFSAFLLHGIMTFLGAFALFFANGFFSSVLFKTNFELSGIIQKNAYENTYYAYHSENRKSIREFIEGIVYPVATIIGTLFLIGLQFLLLEKHYDHFIYLALAFLICGLVFFTIQLKTNYTRLNLYNLSGGDPGMAFMAVDILSQRGHAGSESLLLNQYKNSNDQDLKIRIIQRLPYLNSKSAVHALIEVCKDEDLNLAKHGVRSIRHMKSIIKKFGLVKRVSIILDDYINKCESDFEKAFAVSVLGRIDHMSVEKYLTYESPIIVSQAAIALYQSKGYRSMVKRIIASIINSETVNDKWALIYLSGRIPSKYINEFINANIGSNNEELNMIALICAMRNNRFNVVSQLNNLLLFGNTIVFEKAVEVLDQLDENIKRRISKALIPYGITKEMPDTPEAHRLYDRIMRLYKVCDASDEFEFMHYNMDQLIPIYSKVRI